MAIFGSLENVLRQVASDARFAPAFGYLREIVSAGSAANASLRGLATGATNRVELGNGVFAIEQVYAARTRPEAFFESHRKYIDVQVVVAGEEAMEVQEIQWLTVSEPFVAERDLIKYADTDGASRLVVRPGDAAVFFPEDGHMPSLQIGGPATMYKTVVKVPVAGA